MDSGLVVTETTISMLTDEPYDKLQDNVTQVPCVWSRDLGRPPPLGSGPALGAEAPVGACVLLDVPRLS